jgi:glycosyltransferase involved in cell wall biosynthesis
MNKQIHMLCLFDYNAITGFATVSKNLISNWKRQFGDNLKIDIVAVNYFGEDYNEGINIRVISAKKKDVAKDDFGRYVFMRSLADIDYDLVFILQDLGVIIPLVPHLKKIQDDKKEAKRKLFKSIFYFPVDFALTPNLAVGIDFFDQLSTFTEYGRKMLLNLNPELKSKIRVIPHGNNMKNYYPIESQKEKTDFRKQFFGDNADKFIVGCVNRNQSRKDIPTTIFGFMEYWESHNKNAFLYLHMDPKDPMGWDLRTILKQTPLREGVDYMFPPETEKGYKGTSVEDMNKIYNSLDVFLSTATGGGWELTVTEAMACRVPTIIPRHTSFQILGGENAERTYYIETLYPIVATVDNIIRFQSDLYEISDILDLIHRQLYQAESHLINKINAAYKFVESLDWKDISKKFADDIKRLA